MENLSTNNSHIFTKEEFIAYGNRLHYNTAFDIFVNSIAVYIVWKHSTPGMKVYKYYILLTIFCAFFMDFHITFIFGTFIMLPSTIMCGAGFISRNFDVVWGQQIPSAILHINLSTVGLSIIYGLLYQYFSLRDNVEFFHKPLNITLLILIMLIYPFPSIFLCVLYSDYQASLAHVKQVFPNSFDLFRQVPCHTVIMDSGGKIYYFVVCGQIMLAVTVAYFIAFKIHRKLKYLNNILSEATLKAKKQFLIALILQLTIPSLLVVVPVCFMLITVLAGFLNMNVLSNFVIPIMAFHSPVNALTVILVIAPYRQTLKRWINIIICRNQKIISPQNTIHLTTQISAT